MTQESKQTYMFQLWKVLHGRKNRNFKTTFKNDVPTSIIM